MTFWALVVAVGLLAAAVSWRASRRAFDDEQTPVRRVAADDRPPLHR